MRTGMTLSLIAFLTCIIRARAKENKKKSGAPAPRFPPRKRPRKNEMAAKKVTRKDLSDASETYKNWGKWGPDDEIGTLNYTSAEDIIQAAKLVRKGQVISLALNYDKDGPQGGKTKFPPVGRFNPVHTMLRSGSDAYSGTLDKRGI